MNLIHIHLEERSAEIFLKPGHKCVAKTMTSLTMKTNFSQHESPAQQAVLRQAPSLFQIEFTSKWDLVLPL